MLIFKKSSPHFIAKGTANQYNRSANVAGPGGSRVQKHFPQPSRNFQRIAIEPVLSSIGLVIVLIGVPKSFMNPDEDNGLEAWIG
jgi:hypothetical protein